MYRVLIFALLLTFIYMYIKEWGIRFADNLIFLKYPMKMKYFGLTETKLYHFHMIFKNGGRGARGFELERTPEFEPPLDPPLIQHAVAYVHHADVSTTKGLNFGLYLRLHLFFVYASSEGFASLARLRAGICASSSDPSTKISCVDHRIRKYFTHSF